MKEKEVKLTEADYLEIMNMSRKPEYADSMVYYRGKALKRCPSGTKNSGGTCVPSSAQLNSLPKYNKKPLGGVSDRQIEKLSKAQNTEQIIEAHKSEKETND